MGGASNPELLLECLACTFKLLSKSSNWQAYNFTNRYEIQEIEPSFSSLIFADKGLFDTDSFCHLDLRQTILSPDISQKLEQDFSFALSSARTLR